MYYLGKYNRFMIFSLVWFYSIFVLFLLRELSVEVYYVIGFINKVFYYFYVFNLNS